jgi:hypothetical protein
MAIRLLKLAEPLATCTSHSTLNWVVDVVVVTACSDTGIAASAGSVFMETWSMLALPAFSTQSMVSPAPVLLLIDRYLVALWPTVLESDKQLLPLLTHRRQGVRT